MEAAVSDLCAKHCKRMKTENRIKMTEAIREAYDAGKNSVKPPEVIAMEWRNIKDEKPPVGVKVIGRRRGKWTNLIMRHQNMDSRGRIMDVYHSGNSIRNWVPDEWFPLPV